jgi:hypothetical protein
MRPTCRGSAVTPSRSRKRVDHRRSDWVRRRRVAGRNVLIRPDPRPRQHGRLEGGHRSRGRYVREGHRLCSQWRRTLWRRHTGPAVRDRLLHPGGGTFGSRSRRGNGCWRRRSRPLAGDHRMAQDQDRGKEQAVHRHRSHGQSLAEGVDTGRPQPESGRAFAALIVTGGRGGRTSIRPGRVADRQRRACDNECRGFSVRISG